MHMCIYIYICIHIHILRADLHGVLVADDELAAVPVDLDDVYMNTYIYIYIHTYA